MLTPFRELAALAPTGWECLIFGLEIINPLLFYVQWPRNITPYQAKFDHFTNSNKAVDNFDFVKHIAAYQILEYDNLNKNYEISSLLEWSEKRLILSQLKS